jgi:hypothetical protein
MGSHEADKHAGKVTTVLDRLCVCWFEFWIPEETQRSAWIIPGFMDLSGAKHVEVVNIGEILHVRFREFDCPD